MTNYRRLVVPGGTYFFTVRLQDRSSDLLVRRVDLLRQCVRLCHARWSFRIDAAVVLPDHLHMIWTLPRDDGDFSKRWRLIKSTFSRHVPAPDHIRPSMARRGEKGIWQRRFWEHLIRDETEWRIYRRFVHTAPVRGGLVAHPGDWPFSSYHRQADINDLQARDQGGYGPLVARKVDLDPPYLRTTVPAP